MADPAKVVLPESVERALTGEDGAHAIQCDCDFDPVCDDPTHQSPEYHIGTECSIVQDNLRRAVAAALLRAGADGWHGANVLLKGTIPTYSRQHLDKAYQRNEDALRAQAAALEAKP